LEGPKAGRVSGCQRLVSLDAEDFTGPRNPAARAGVPPALV